MTLVCDSQTRQEQATKLGERRRGLRIPRNQPVKVYDPVTNRYLGGQTHDISSAGLCLELPLAAHIQPGRVLSVHVGVSSSGSMLASSSHMVPARVVWVDADSDAPTGILTTGIEFLTAAAATADAA